MQINSVLITIFWFTGKPSLYFLFSKTKAKRTGVKKRTNQSASRAGGTTSSNCIMVYMHCTWEKRKQAPTLSSAFALPAPKPLPK